MKILPTSYFGNIYYYYELLTSNLVQIELYENYPKQTFRNRSNIVNSNGIICLSVPIEKKNNNFSYTKDMKISYQTDWVSYHLKTISTAYSHAPFFEYIFYDIENILKEKHKFIIDLNNQLLILIFKFLKIETSKIKYTNSYIKNYEHNIIDLRNVFKETQHNIFTQNIIFPEYNQVFFPKLQFMKNLSIIDLIFNIGNEAFLYFNKIQNAPTKTIST
ncbi:MAG: hypothetical protein A2X02_05840 [Bacteroidetes bacterium GWF2_29_10]|nr:MAG: hypothetical protein A2X02_05840 [Bacteroidetes bacterium GWF2_29_10]